MQRETSNDSFLDYGSVYHQPIDREHPELIHQRFDRRIPCHRGCFFAVIL